MKYAPAWVLSVACSVITKRYVEEHVPFQSFINAISGNFETLYDDLTESKLRAGVEMEMRFLASFDHENHMKIVNAHIFNVITYKKPKIKRKLKGIFSDGTKPKRTDYHKVRVIKKNLVYIIGLAPGLAREEVNI